MKINSVFLKNYRRTVNRLSNSFRKTANRLSNSSFNSYGSAIHRNHFGIIRLWDGKKTSFSSRTRNWFASNHFIFFFSRMKHMRCFYENSTSIVRVWDEFKSLFAIIIYLMLFVFSRHCLMHIPSPILPNILYFLKPQSSCR